jgi:hypothetical protein
MTDWIGESARMDGESMPNGINNNPPKLISLLTCCINVTLALS